MIDRSAQAPMVIVLKRDETEGLQHASCGLSQGIENLRHAMHGPGLRLKCEFDKRSASQRMLQLQQSASYGNGLKFSFCTPAVF